VADAPFAFTKWYLDCVADDGRVAIGYWASLSWRAVSLVWQGLSLYEPGCPPFQRTTLRRHLPPKNDHGRIRWENPGVGVVLTAEIRQPMFGLRLFEAHSGYAEWQCEAPVARVTLEADGRPAMHGCGYVEQLTLTLPPWQLPLDELRWGRWIDAHGDRSLVWIEWRGAEPRRWVFVDGVRTPDASVLDDRVLAGATVLRLEDYRTLSCRALDDVVGAIPGLRPIVPPSLLAWRESKWISRGVASRGDAFMTGSAIHERVIIR
jgi:hypothetical protein